MNEPLLQARDLRVQYPGRRSAVLDVAALDVPTGSALAIVGPSGAGKSTLLRVLGLIEPPSAGSVRLEGVLLDATALPALALRRRIATVFQRPQLLTSSVLDNVAYGLRIRAVPKPEREARALAALTELQLAPLAHAQANTLSGGELQRAALARALVLHPDLLLLDEPTANLDPANTALIEAALNSLRSHHNCTLIMVTHNLFQARRLSTHVAVLLEGKLVEFGLTDTVFDHARDPRAADFLAGRMVW